MSDHLGGSLVPSRIIVVMGVASSGKTVTGSAIAAQLGAPFLDGDDFHPAANKDKMRAGIPLADDDRWPWLAALADAAQARAAEGMVVAACSALRRLYRNYLVAKAGQPILFVHLEGSRELLAQRIASRQHEYMPASLLDSQFAALEVPAADENAVAMPVTLAPREIAGRVALLCERWPRR